MSPDSWTRGPPAGRTRCAPLGLVLGAQTAPAGTLVCLGCPALTTVPPLGISRLPGAAPAPLLSGGRWSHHRAKPRCRGPVWFLGQVSRPGTVQAPRGSTREGSGRRLCDREAGSVPRPRDGPRTRWLPQDPRTRLGGRSLERASRAETKVWRGWVLPERPHNLSPVPPSR